MAPSYLESTSPTLSSIKRESVEVKLEDHSDCNSLPLATPGSELRRIKVEENHRSLSSLGILFPKQEPSVPKFGDNFTSPFALKLEPTELKLENGSIPLLSSSHQSSSPIDLTGCSPYSLKKEPPNPISDIIDLTNSPVSHRNTKIQKTGSTGSYLESSSDSDSSVVLVGTNPKPRPPLHVIGGLKLYAAYPTYEAAEEAAYGAERAKGFPWRRGQLYKDGNGQPKKRTLRCCGYLEPRSVHSPLIDPGDYRRGQSARSGCMAHVNIRLQSGGFWVLTLINFTHNHPPPNRPGISRPLPPSSSQRKLVRKYANQPKFERSHLKKLLQESFQDHPLEDRQITNLINAARREVHDTVVAQGGDFPAVLSYLQALKQQDPGWDYRPQLDGSNTVVAFWWQSPGQAELARRYWDILVADTAYNHNQYGYALNTGIIIDNFGKSRNVWYCLQKSESVALHTWVLQNHLDTAQRAPEIFASDRHISLCIAIPSVIPFTHHIYCLHHLTSNVNQNLRSRIGHDQWISFSKEFWIVYRAISPETFDRLWNELLLHYPDAREYLENELYPCRQRWAWAWVSHMFTAGIRTNGRLEVENRINKQLGGPKKTALQLVQALNERTNEQSQKERENIREVYLALHNLSATFAS